MEFDKGKMKIWDVWCKGGSVFDDGWNKTNCDFKLKILDCYIFASGIERSFVKP
jgi:hypothetical protein